MTVSRRRIIAIMAATALSPKAALASPDTVRWSGVAMGASASLTITGLPRSEANRLIVMARSEIERLETIFSLYREDSVLAKLNRDGLVKAPSLDLVQLLSQVSSIHNATGGLFDPSIQPLWVLHAASSGRPDPTTLEAVRQRIGWHHVDIRSNAISFKRAGMALTLNGIAQGYVTDRIADLLRAQGLRNVLVNVGEIAAIGGRGPGTPWRVGLSEAGDGAPEEEVALYDMAIATSAPLGTTLNAKGTAGHILDPGNGQSQSGWRRVSVIHRSATIADGLSTAFTLMDRNQIGTTLASYPRTRLIAVDNGGLRFTHKT